MKRRPNPPNRSAPPSVPRTEEERRLQEIFLARRRDRAQLKSRRQKTIDAPLRKFDSLIEGMFQEDRQTLRKIEETRACLAWEQLVGPTAARFSHAQRMRGPQLVVKVSDPLWLTQLSLLKTELLQKYQTQFPQLGIRDIFFVR